MAEYPTLEFNTSRTEVTIVFNANEKSLVYTTKEAVFQTINVLLQEETISCEKANQMRQEIIEEANVPVSIAEETVPVIIIIRPIIIPQYFFFFSEKEIHKPLEPFLELCDDGGIPHYHIICTTGYTMRFDTKTEGKTLLTYLKHDNFITVQEEKMLLKEIEKLDIPSE